MSDGEKPSGSKFVKSFFEAVPWLKNIRYAIGIVLIFLVVYMVYRTWFYKPQGNVSKPIHNPTVWMLPNSGNIDTLDQSQDVKTDQKIEEKKRQWWMPIPYVSVFAEMRGNGTDLSHHDTGWGVQGGVRWDF